MRKLLLTILERTLLILLILLIPLIPLILMIRQLLPQMAGPTQLKKKNRRLLLMMTNSKLTMTTIRLD